MKQLNLRTGLMVILAVVISAATAHVLSAQEYTSGEITGFVLDPSGAAVPDASISAVETGTGFERRVSSDAKGFFAFGKVPMGTYNVSGEHKGFKRATETGLLLGAGATVAVHLTLQLGDVRQTVQITATPTPVESETAQVGRIVDPQQMMELPILGRNSANVLMFEPGASNLRLPDYNGAADNFAFRMSSLNGTNSRLFGPEEHLTIDGVEAVRTDGVGGEIGMASVDAIQEVIVLTSNYPAEYGRGGGPQVVFITKSGTKDFHGSGYDFVQNNVFNARSYFSPTVSILRQNQFGGTIGGPVYIPGIWNTGKSKAFFFFSNETVLIRNYTLASGIVPTAMERQGNFTGSGTAVPIDPLTGVAFPGEVVPQARWSTNGPALMSMYPATNATFSGGNFQYYSPNWTNMPDYQMKGDYDLQRTRISATINLTRLTLGNSVRGSFPMLPDQQSRLGYRYGINATTTFSPTVLNELQLGYSTDHELLLRVNGPDGGVDRSTFGINFPYLYPLSGKECNKIPTLSVGGMSLVDGGNYCEAGHRGPQEVLRDNITWIRGAHTFKFGGVIERDGLNTSDLGGSDQNGSFTFNASSLNPRTTKNPLADLLLGNFDSYSEQAATVFNVLRNNAFELFAQDGWKVTHKLKVEVGVRYNIFPHYYETCNAISVFDPQYYSSANAPQISSSNGSIVAGTNLHPYNGIMLPGSGWPSDPRCKRFLFSANSASTALFHNVPRGQVPTSWNVFDPRLGFAWSPFGDKTVIRGGAGVYHTDDVFSSNYAVTSYGLPLEFPMLSVSTVNYGNVDNPSGGLAPASFPPTEEFDNPNMKVPVMYQFSLGVQRELPGHVLLDVGYVGQQERNLWMGTPYGALPYNYCYYHLPTNCNALQPYLGFSTISQLGNGMYERYNSLQITARRRFANGLFFNGTYTWAHETELNYSVRDPFNIDLDEGPAVGLRPQVANLTFIYELPFWKHSQNVAQRMVGGWQLSGFWALAAGLPMTVGINSSLAAQAGTATRPDQIGNPNVVGSQGKFYSFWNEAAFAQPAVGTLGNAGYDTLRGAGDNNWDLGLMKNFHLSPKSETLRLQYGAEFFNAFNHPQISYNGVSTTWDSTLSASTFGHVTGMASDRIIQMSLKLYF